MPTLIRSLIKNGKTPTKVSEIGTFFAILFIIKTFKPTGGVISPTSTTNKSKDTKPDCNFLNTHSKI